MRNPSRTTRLEISELFWRDLAPWRREGGYLGLRRRIADLVARSARGEIAGDAPMVSDTWKGIGHARFGGLTLFTVRSDAETLKLCALKKHAEYGYRGAGRSREAATARVVREAAEGPSVASPGWDGLRWRDPSEIARHPDLRELSLDGLRRLYADVLEEQDGFARFNAQARGLHGRMKAALEGAWIEALIEAQDAVEARIVQASRPARPHVAPQDFTAWLEPR